MFVLDFTPAAHICCVHSRFSVCTVKYRAVNLQLRALTLQINAVTYSAVCIHKYMLLFKAATDKYRGLRQEDVLNCSEH